MIQGIAATTMSMVSGQSVVPGGESAAGNVQPEIIPTQASMSRMKIGWLGTPLFATETIVISTMQDGQRLDMAVRPDDGDLDRAWDALIRAGVRR